MDFQPTSTTAMIGILSHETGRLQVFSQLRSATEAKSTTSNDRLASAPRRTAKEGRLTTKANAAALHAPNSRRKSPKLVQFGRVS